MKLPNADKAIVEREKMVDYLLNAAHRHGASKALFFARFGFRMEAWEEQYISKSDDDDDGTICGSVIHQC